MQDTPIAMPGDPGGAAGAAAGAAIALTGFSGDIGRRPLDATPTEEPPAYEDLVPAPLSECYDHHWVAMYQDYENALCKSFHHRGHDPTFTFGIGAESRHSSVRLPEGYGYVIPAGRYFMANVHLLRTQGLAPLAEDANATAASADTPRAIKECIECHYTPGFDSKGSDCTSDTDGLFQCCGDSAYCYENTCGCPTTPESTESVPDEIEYFLRYEVNYTVCPEEVQAVEIGVLTAPDCETFYSVQENNTAPEHVASVEIDADFDGRIVHAYGHQHIGAINVTLRLNGEVQCASWPRYGTVAGEAGNELGYLVEMSECIGPGADTASGGRAEPLLVRKGDKLRVDGWYFVGQNDTRIAIEGGTHQNVMSYLIMAYHVDSPPSPPPPGVAAAPPTPSSQPSPPQDSSSDGWGGSGLAVALLALAVVAAIAGGVMYVRRRRREQNRMYEAMGAEQTSGALELSKAR